MHPSDGSLSMDKDDSMTQKKDKEKKSGLSTTKMLGAALAAITVSIITTKLTSYVGGIAIVGVSSLLIAILSEAYTKILRKTKKVAAKATYKIPYQTVLPASMASKLDSSLLSAMVRTSTMEPLTEDKIKEVEEQSVERTEGSNDEPNDNDTDNEPLPVVKKKKKWFSPSPTTKMILMFAGIALVTSFVSWGVSTYVEKPDVMNVTNVEKVEQLSQKEKDAIKEAAAAAVQNQIASAQKDADDANDSVDTLSERIDALSTSISSLTTRMSALEKSATNSKSENDSSDDVKTLSNEITSLQQQIKTLQKQLDSLKAESSSAAEPN